MFIDVVEGLTWGPQHPVKCVHRLHQRSVKFVRRLAFISSLQMQCRPPEQVQWCTQIQGLLGRGTCHGAVITRCESKRSRRSLMRPHWWAAEAPAS